MRCRAIVNRSLHVKFSSVIHAVQKLRTAAEAFLHVIYRYITSSLPHFLLQGAKSASHTRDQLTNIDAKDSAMNL
jgi:hypothetical protein